MNITEKGPDFQSRCKVIGKDTGLAEPRNDSRVTCSNQYEKSGMVSPWWGGGGGESQVERSGMFVGTFELNP